MPRKKIIEQHRAMVDFNEHYDYFGKSRLLKLMVRAAVAARCLLKIAEFHLSSDKRVIKGPGAPQAECHRPNRHAAGGFADRRRLADSACNHAHHGSFSVTRTALESMLSGVNLLINMPLEVRYAAGAGCRNLDCHQQ